jgi:putative component of toxin-antitoxin plasmid stabilization module
MKTIYTTEVFDLWFESLKDRQTARRIQTRIDRAEEGNFTQRGMEIVILLAGGDKSSQTQDIAIAHELARQLKE